MIAWLVKNWKLFLDIVLVAGGIILFTLFDPFGVFSSRSLKNTANILSSVKSIGELVTAEYYGEVISSLHGTMVYDLQPDTLQQEFERCLAEVKAEVEKNYLDKLKDDTKLKRREKNKLLDALPEKLNKTKNTYNQSNKIYDHLIAFIASNEYQKDAQEFYNVKSESLKNKVENEVLETLLNECISSLQLQESTNTMSDSTSHIDFKYSIPEYFSKVSDFHYSLNKSHIQKTKKRKQDIVFIGRGWVKAGFRFKQLNETNFYYDDQRKIIRFYGLSPVVLDEDINPWFIPEKKVKGFELVDFYKKATFEEAKAVKIRCKEELLEQAYKADILQQAQINGEESLQSFFALLTNEPNLKIEFHNLPYQKEINMIAADTLITVNEALRIKKIIDKETKQIKNAISPDKEFYEQQLGIFINQLKLLDFVKKGTAFNPYMLEAAEILAHKAYITSNDSIVVNKVRGSIILIDTVENPFLTTNYLDGIIFESSYPKFVNDFNAMLKLLESEISELDELRTDTFTLTNYQIQSLLLDSAFFHFQTVSTNNNDTVQYIKVAHKQSKRSFAFTDFSFPVLEIPANALDTISIKNLSSVDVLLNSLAKKNSITTLDKHYNTIRKNELAIIKSYQSDKIKREITLRPTRKFTTTVQRIFGKN